MIIISRYLQSVCRGLIYITFDFVIAVDNCTNIISLLPLSCHLLVTVASITGYWLCIRRNICVYLICGFLIQEPIHGYKLLFTSYLILQKFVHYTFVVSQLLQKVHPLQKFRTMYIVVIVLNKVVQCPQSKISLTQ